MSVQTQPEEINDASLVMVSSDAPDNISAIREIDQWARDNGFVRSREYNLNIKQTADGKRLYYGACYRLSQDDKRAAETDLTRIRQRRAEMPLTASSELLLQEGH